MAGEGHRVVIVDDGEPLENKPTDGQGVADLAHDGGRARRVRRWQVLVVVVLVAVAAVAWVVGARRGSPGDPAPSAAAGGVTTSSRPTATASPVPSGTEGPEPVAEGPFRSAARDLDGFLARATVADQALREASSRINASITATEVTYDERTSALLASAAPETVAPALPAGMPEALQRDALLVYSDLVSRWAAMSGGGCNPGVGTFPRALVHDQRECFTQGAPAAARFAGDLAALRQRAEQTPEFAVVGQDSRAAEELAVRMRLIELGNLGCGSTGGFVATDPIPIVWQEIPDDREEVGGPDWQGTVGAGIPFRGTFDPALGWDIELFAC